MKPRTSAGLRVTGLAVVTLLVGLVGAGLVSGQEGGESPLAPQVTVTVYASGDATLKSWDPNSNFGGDTTLEVSYSNIDVPQAAFALLRFDLSTIPADAIIDSAYVELNLTSGAGADPVNIGAYYVNSDWDEYTVTWNTALNVASIGVGTWVDAVPGYKAWGGISGFVQGWLDGPNNGLQLRGPFSAGTPYYQRSFGSRNGRVNTPRLVVTYHLPPPADTATPTPTVTLTTTPTTHVSSTPTPTASATRTATPTTLVASTPTPTSTASATRTATPTTLVASTPTRTPTASATSTRTRTPTGATSTPTATRRFTSTPTHTPSPTMTLPPGCPDLLINGGFETGSLPPWGSDGPAGVAGPGRNSEFYAWLNGQDNAQAEVFQQVTLPRDGSPIRLAFWWRADVGAEQPDDFLHVLVQYGEHADMLYTVRAVAPLGQWRREEVDLSAYAGMAVLVTFHAHTDDARPTTFRLDDAGLLACGLATATPTPTRTPTATPVVITFEEAIPNPDTVRTQYCNNPPSNRGVEFLDGGRIYIPGVGVNNPTHAFTNRSPGEEFGTNKTVAIRFTAGQKLVGVKVGLDRAYTFPLTAELRAYSSTTPGSGFITYNTRYLGNGPTAVTQDLAVTSAAGDIRSVVIEFSAATPNYWGYEVIDDLSFSTIGPPCISDTTAPTVQITQPATDGLTFQSPSLRLAFAANDAGTGLAKIQVVFLNAGGGEVGSFYVCGAASAPACIYDVTPYTASYDFLTTLPANTQRIRVRAWDFAGQVGQAERVINLVAIGYFNLWAQAMEITQATQAWLPINAQASLSGATPPTFTYPAAPTAVPLAAGRTTAVRVYAGVAGTTGNVQLDNVRAQLRCFTGATYQIPCPGYPWVNPQSLPPNSSQITIRPNDSLDTKRRDAKLSWNFILPQSWTAAGTIYLESVVLPPYGLQECAGCADAANRLRVSGVKFQTVPDFTDQVHFVRIRRQLGNQTFEPTQAQMDAHVDYLLPLYPVDEATLPTAPDATWTWNDCGNTCDSDPKKNLGARCNRVHSDLMKAFPNRANKLAVYALIDNGFPCAGVGGGGYSYGGANRVDSFPHEVGHAVGLNHCGPPPGHGSVCPPPGGGNCAECNPASWCDTDWPWPHGTLGTYGLNVFNMAVFKPGTTEADTHDFMSYGGPTQWVSSRTWIRLFNAFTGQALPYPKLSSSSNAGVSPAAVVSTAQEPQPYLLVSGEQGSDGRWRLGPAYKLEFPAGSDDALGDGEYSLALLNAEGESLFVRRLVLGPGHVDTFDRSGLAAPLSFVELLPLPEGVATLALRRGEAVLATVERSPKAPEVAILSPTAAGFEGPPGALRIRWAGSDVDGATLRYRVQYQANAEAEWRTLATDWTATELAVDLTDLPGGEAARVRVLATDGLNTGVAVSPAFRVLGRSPQVRILLPATGTTIQEGERLVLEGAASDMEDGLLAPDALAWRADGDRLLGRGRRLEVSDLPAGEHEITLSATDNDGQVGVAAVTVVVTQRPNTQPIADAGPDQTAAGQCAPALAGRASRDVDGDRLVSLWSIVGQPAGSRAWLSNPEGPTSHFFADRAGDYEIELTVHDGQVASVPDRVAVRVTGAGANRVCAYLPLILRAR